MSLKNLLVSALFTFGSFSSVMAKPAYEKIMIMMFENQGYAVTLANEYWDSISRQGLLLTNVYAITHPSQCNYISQIGGSLFGCTGDSNYSTDSSSLPDLVEAAGLTWKSYQENYTPKSGGDCDTSTSQSSLYYRKHNPFMSFSLITGNKTRCQNIVNANQFNSDAKNGKLPDFIYYTPNINNDAHNTDLDTSGQYLQSFLQQNLPYLNNTLLFITWDEDEYTENNHIFALQLGPGITPNTQDDATKYTHYSVAASIEENWSLGNLGRNDASAASWLNAKDNASARTDKALQA